MGFNSCKIQEFTKVQRLSNWFGFYLLLWLCRPIPFFGQLWGIVYYIVSADARFGSLQNMGVPWAVFCSVGVTSFGGLISLTGTVWGKFECSCRCISFTFWIAAIVFVSTECFVGLLITKYFRLHMQSDAIKIWWIDPFFVFCVACVYIPLYGFFCLSTLPW